MKTPTALLAIALTGAALFAAQSNDEKPIWHADWATAQRSARKAGKPIFAVMVCKH